MKTMQYKRLAIAMSLTGAIGLGASTAQAVDFGASATLQNTLEVTVVNDMDLGTLFATKTGAALANGVAAVVISPDGTAAGYTGDSADVELVSLGGAVGAQGSVDVTSTFNLLLPDTSGIDPDDFVDDTTTGTLADIKVIAADTNATELVHESANPAVPSLYLMHYTVADVSGGSRADDTGFDGTFVVTQDFGETSYVFNIGATVTTSPETGGELDYQAGIYSGTFVVTAEY